MSLRLQARGIPGASVRETVLGRIETRPVAGPERPDSVRLILGAEVHSDGEDLAGYAGLLTEGPSSPDVTGIPWISSARPLAHLRNGDVVALQPDGTVRTLFRPDSPHNAIFTTDRCNSLCVMCSQPPRAVDDGERIHEHLRLIDLIATRGVPIRELGITGGEPTLLKGDLLRLVAHCRDRLPQTALHMLSNGRLFYYGSFARRLAEIDHPDLMIGIPLYADTASTHDEVVQAPGAFGQTMVGLQNLGRYGVPVEIRVVLERPTIARLRPLAEFIYRNLPFAAHVALMGLEPIGFAATNLDALWLDPRAYRDELEAATLHLAARGMNVSIYNLPLCAVPESVHRFCRRSISDWKNEYLPECDACEARSECCGFFASAIRRRTSLHLKAEPIPIGTSRSSRFAPQPAG